MLIAFPLAQATDPQNQPLEIFGTKLIGLTPDNGHKLLITAIFIVIVAFLNWALRGIARLLLRGGDIEGNRSGGNGGDMQFGGPHGGARHHSHRGTRSQLMVFWTRQGISALLALLLIIGVLSIWFDNPTRLSTFMGLVTAGVAFALQKPISAIAGYLVILRGNTFGVGDRITMGGVRGDVIALGFTQTTIMEMGQPPSIQDEGPATWVRSRQYTGRVVTISNSNVFDEPVYNYTREFPFIWEELVLPISYKDDRKAAEQILLEVAHHHTHELCQSGQRAMESLGRRYLIAPAVVAPTVYYRLTDNWVELTVRFIASTHGARDLKDVMSRDIIERLDRVKIGVASGTYELVGVPPIQVQLAPQSAPPVSPPATSSAS